MEPIRMVDLKSQYLRIKSEVDAAIQCVLDSTAFIQGEAVSDFEQHLSQYVDSKYVASCGNGTDALTAALLALGIGPGDEVVTVPFTFIATVEAIAQVGAKPVLVDVREDSYMMDADKLEAAITPKTKAVIPVHLYGQCADMDCIFRRMLRECCSTSEPSAACSSSYSPSSRSSTIGSVAVATGI